MKVCNETGHKALQAMHKWENWADSLLLQRTFHLTFEVALQNAIMSLSILLSPFYRQRNSCTERESNFNHVSDQQLKENCKKKPASSELWLLQLKSNQHCLVNGCNTVFWNAQSSPTPLSQIRNFWVFFKKACFFVSSRNRFDILKFLIKVWRLLCSALCWNTSFLF